MSQNTDCGRGGSDCRSNTDREIWREEDSFYSPSISVTDRNMIVISVAGLSFIKSVKEWHQLAKNEWLDETPGEQELIDGINKQLKDFYKDKQKNIKKPTPPPDRFIREDERPLDYKPWWRKII